jgi:repressor LexA
MKTLTDKQQAVYSYIQLSVKSNNHQPSIKEMAEYFSVSEPAIINRLDLIEKKGFIRRTGKARAIEIL